MHLRASVPDYGYDIRGELKAEFFRDKTLGDVVGRIPVLRLTAQGRDEQEAEALLLKIFEEFCGVALVNGHFLEILVEYGFEVRSASHGEARSSQYLEIARTSDEGSVGERKYLAEDLVGA